MILLKINHRLGDLVLRFKKFNSNLISSNIATQQSLNYSEQIELQFIKKSIHLNAGYTLTKVGELGNCYITCPAGKKRIEWYLLISENNSGQILPNIIQLPLGPTTPQLNKKRANPKQENKNIEEQDRNKE